jgi:hypothetical protein
MLGFDKRPLFKSQEGSEYAPDVEGALDMDN